MSSTTAPATIQVLFTLFSRYGYPQHVVSDNGPQFIAEEFKAFLKINGIKHTLTPPYHPASNGLAERHVQIFKGMFKKLGGHVEYRTSKVLLAYRNILHGTTNKTPSELFLGRSPRTRLSLVKPDLRARVEGRQERSIEHYDHTSSRRAKFEVFQNMKIRNVRGGGKWISGTIVEITGPSTYVVRIPGNTCRLVHIDQMIPDETRGVEAVEQPPDGIENLPIQDTLEQKMKEPPIDLPPATDPETFTSPKAVSPVKPAIVSPRTPEHTSPDRAVYSPRPIRNRRPRQILDL